jgi:GT2 family glycosyltransferase
MRMFQQQPALDLVYSNALVVDDPNHTRKFMDRCPSQGDATFCALVVEHCQIPISTVVVRRAAIIKAGLFDESLSCYDDYDMWLRTAFHGGKIGYTREAQARLSGKRPGSLSDSIHRIVAAYWSILEKALRTLPVSQAERKVITNRLAESKALFQMEEAKRHLQSRQFGKAKELFREANRHFHRPEVKLTVFALGIAPGATRKVIETWSRMRSGVTG